MISPLEDQPVQRSIGELIDYFNKGIHEAATYLSPARSSKLQVEQCSVLDRLLNSASNLKQEAVRREIEDHANLFLAFECSIGAVRAELLMWILLKRDLPNEAWNQLVAAQMASLDASRAHRSFVHCRQNLERLEEIESLIFPPQVYMSAGFTSKALECSICGERYSRCDHLRGKPYMGEFCEVIHRDPIGDHVAIVETPADKRCRIVSFKTMDGNRDRLSWTISPYKDGESFKEGETLEVKSIFLSLDRYPYLTSSEETLNPLR